MSEEKAKPQSKVKKVCSLIGNIAFWTVAVLSVVLAITAVVLGKSSTTPPFVFGRAVLWVETGSMEPEIKTKSFILVKRSDGSDVEVGDVITFVCTDEGSEVNGQLITHRVIEITEDGFITKGDNSPATDSWGAVKQSDVVAVYRRNLPILTFFGRLFRTSFGITALLLVFAVSSAALYVPDIIKAIHGDEAEQKEREFNRRVEEEVKRLTLENAKIPLQNGDVDVTETDKKSDIANATSTEMDKVSDNGTEKDNTAEKPESRLTESTENKIGQENSSNTDEGGSTAEKDENQQKGTNNSTESNGKQE